MIASSESFSGWSFATAAVQSVASSKWNSPPGPLSLTRLDSDDTMPPAVSISSTIGAGTASSFTNPRSCGLGAMRSLSMLVNNRLVVVERIADPGALSR